MDSEVYECEGKGGSYELVEVTSAGALKGQQFVLYRCLETGRLFLRTEEDFKARMKVK